MTWDVHLWCQQCDGGAGRMIGQVANVDSLRHSQDGPAIETVRRIMRDHEIEKHGGKS